jgi:hypothetical protein
MGSSGGLEKRGPRGSSLDAVGRKKPGIPGKVTRTSKLQRQTARAPSLQWPRPVSDLEPAPGAQERETDGEMVEDWMRVAFAPHLHQTPELRSREPVQRSQGDTLVLSHASPQGQQSTTGGRAEENAIMRVRAHDAGDVQLAEWKGGAFFLGELPVRYVGQGPPWRWDHPSAQSIKVNSDAAGASGQSLARWAPRGARRIVVEIAAKGAGQDLADTFEMEPESIRAGGGAHGPASQPPGDEVY